LIANRFKAAEFPKIFFRKCFETEKKECRLARIFLIYISSGYVRVRKEQPQKGTKFTKKSFFNSFSCAFCAFLRLLIFIFDYPERTLITSAPIR